MKKIIIYLGIVLMLMASVFATGEKFWLSDSNVLEDGVAMTTGSITVTVYNVSEGGTPMYSELFSNSIVNGSYSIEVGNDTTLDLNLGETYYYDLNIDGQDIDFSGSERREFRSPVGTILDSSLSSNVPLLNLGNNFTGINNFSNQTIFNGVQYTFPSSDGTANYTLTTNGAGTLTWAEGSTLAVGGTSGQVQYNDGASGLAGASSLYYDSGNNYVGIGTTSPSNILDVVGNIETTKILVGDGSVSAPSVGFNSNSDVGLYYERENIASSLNYTGNSFSVATQGSFIRGLAWDDTYFWAIDESNDEVYRYTSAGTYDNFNFSVSNGDSNAIAWNGSTLWIVGTNQLVKEYYTNGTATGTSFSISGQITTPVGLTWDGSYWWIASSTDAVYKYNSAGTYQSVTYSLASQGAGLQGLTWDDNNFWTVDRIENKMFQYYANWTYTGASLLVSTQDADGYGVEWDGSELWIVGDSTDTAYEYGYLTIIDKLKTTINSNEKLSIEDSSIYFDTNLVYMNTTNNFVGINTASPTYDFQVNNALYVNDTSDQVGIGIAPVGTSALTVSGETLTNTLDVDPQSAPPSSPTMGTIYVDIDTGELCFYNGTAWLGISAGGSCVS